MLKIAKSTLSKGPFEIKGGQFSQGPPLDWTQQKNCLIGSFEYQEHMIWLKNKKIDSLLPHLIWQLIIFSSASPMDEYTNGDAMYHSTSHSCY